MPGEPPVGGRLVNVNPVLDPHHILRGELRGDVLKGQGDEMRVERLPGGCPLQVRVHTGEWGRHGGTSDQDCTTTPAPAHARCHRDCTGSVESFSLRMSRTVMC